MLEDTFLLVVKESAKCYQNFCTRRGDPTLLYKTLHIAHNDPSLE